MATKPKLNPAVKLKTYKAIEEEGIREVLAAFVRQYPNVSQAARALNVTRAYLANVLSGERNVSAYVAGQLGYAEQTLYVPLPSQE